MLHFERCTSISFVYTAFQEADGVGFVESHGKFKPRSRGGKLLGVRRDERPPEGLLGSVLLLQKKRIRLKFENAKHFLHISSYVRVRAVAYGVRRWNGSSKLLPYHRFVRKGYSRDIQREALEWGVDGAAPYRGLDDSRVAIPYGVRRWTGDHIGSPLQW